jgi:hypothetical protein
MAGAGVALPFSHGGDP